MDDELHATDREPKYLSRTGRWGPENEARVTAIEAMTPEQMRDMLMYLCGYEPEVFDRIRFAVL